MKNFRGGQEKLQPEELDQLHQLNIGYGNFINNARKVGLHANTYRVIINRGYGTKRLVYKIRTNILKQALHESDPHQPAEDPKG